MGSCMSSNAGVAEGSASAKSSSSKPRAKAKAKQAFPGAGHRLGSSVPEPALDPTKSERRAAVLEAAEQRARKQKGGRAKRTQTAKAPSGEPLRGPNSQPLMRWTAS